MSETRDRLVRAAVDARQCKNGSATALYELLEELDIFINETASSGGQESENDKRNMRDAKIEVLERLKKAVTWNAKITIEIP